MLIYMWQIFLLTYIWQVLSADLHTAGVDVSPPVDLDLEGFTDLLAAH